MKNRLDRLLSRLNRQISGYTAGNLLNLMRYAGINRSGYDFSEMIIWQADLQDINLHRVNFADCKFANSSLNQNFGGLKAIAFSPDGQYLASGSADTTIKIWNVETGECHLNLSDRINKVMSVVFYPNGQMLASGDGKLIKLWHTETGESIQTFLGHTDLVLDLVVAISFN